MTFKSPQPTVAVVGAGITGVTTAYALAQRGWKVTLIDRHPYAAMETSFANGGQLSASNAEVWNSWATVLKGLLWMLTPGAPLLVSPKPSWHKLSWMLEFLAAIPRYEDNTVTTARLAIEARAHLKRIASTEGIEFDAEERGILHVYRGKAEFEAAARVSALLAKGGLNRRAVTAEEIRTIEPTMHGSFYAGFYTESDFTGDIHKFTRGVARACERLGVTLQYRTSVTAIRASDEAVEIWSESAMGEGGQERDRRIFDRVVICGGVASRRLGRDVGDRINVYPVKGYSITVNLIDHEDQVSAPWVSLLDDRAKIVTSRLGLNRFRVAGTAEFNGYNTDIRSARIAPLVSWCHKHFPAMSTRQAVPWAGLRPMMPDMLPRVMQGRRRSVFYNTGHGHLGWTLSAVTAETVAALMTK